jgi:hypothetical protein
MVDTGQEEGANAKQPAYHNYTNNTQMNQLPQPRAPPFSRENRPRIHHDTQHQPYTRGSGRYGWHSRGGGRGRGRSYRPPAAATYPQFSPPTQPDPTLTHTSHPGEGDTKKIPTHDTKRARYKPQEEPNHQYQYTSTPHQHQRPPVVPHTINQHATNPHTIPHQQDGPPTGPSEDTPTTLDHQYAKYNALMRDLDAKRDKRVDYLKRASITYKGEMVHFTHFGETRPTAENHESYNRTGTMLGRKGMYEGRDNQHDATNIPT